MVLTEKDVAFQAVRASKPGGQRTNRRATKVQARVQIDDLPLNDSEKRRIKGKLSHRLTKNGELIVESEEERFQIRNKEIALARLNELINEALEPKPPRIPTRPSRGAKERRLQEKKLQGRKKSERSKRWGNN